MIARGKAAFGALLAALLLLALTVVDAARRSRARDREQPAVTAAIRELPSPDLAVAGGARQLRHVSQAEPAAAFADGPEAPDTDPAGGALAPPVDAWREEAR